MGQFDSFYQGSMAPPLTVDGRLIPTPTILSPAQIYAGIYPSNPTPQMSSIGPGPGPSGGYSFLQDMIDASTPSVPRIPGPNNTTVAKKSGIRLPSTPASLDPMEAYAGVPKTSAQQAIDIVVRGGVPLPRVRPTPTVPTRTSQWAPPWNVGASGLNWESAQPGAAPAGDPWANDRFGEPVAPRPGYAVGNRAAPQSAPNQPGGLFGLLFGSGGPLSGGGPSASSTPPNNRPIIYSAPVAAGNFAEGSPNQSFEKQNGMGSVTKSMASSSRWNTGY